VDDVALEHVYGYPDDLDRPWVQVNFISSVDGAVTVSGRSGGFGNAADKKVFSLGRDLADVVLVGAGTALIEGYRGVRTTEVRAERRARLGLSPVPPIAVVTARCSIDADSPLITDTAVPTIVITTSSAPADRRDALAQAGADVIVAGEHEVDMKQALRALDERGLRRVNCEGGPQLLGALIADDLVDELCLTVAPVLTGGDAGRIATGPVTEMPRTMRLVSVLHHQDDDTPGALLLRYRRVR
jgi:riboflavin biosynthesis pyrimidine reductase